MRHLRDIDLPKRQEKSHDVGTWAASSFGSRLPDARLRCALSLVSRSFRNIDLQESRRFKPCRRPFSYSLRECFAPTTTTHIHLRREYEHLSTRLLITLLGHPLSEAALETALTVRVSLKSGNERPSLRPLTRSVIGAPVYHLRAPF